MGSRFVTVAILPKIFDILRSPTASLLITAVVSSLIAVMRDQVRGFGAGSGLVSERATRDYIAIR